MPRCLQCQEVYADQLRRCPYCGAGHETLAVPAEEARPDRAALPRNRRRLVGIAILGALLASLGVVLVAALPGGSERPGTAGAEAEVPDLVSPFTGPLAPPDEILPGDPKDGFLVESVDPDRDGVRVSGRCSPDATVRVRVNGRAAVIEPDGSRWSIVVPADDGSLRVTAEGLNGLVHGEEADARRAVGALGDPVRVTSHAEGQTVHAASVVLGVEAERARDEHEGVEAALPGVENRIQVGRGRFTLYRAPEGLVFVRFTARGQYAFLREADGQEMVLVPEGLARRGTGTEPPHGPAHVVRTDAFLIDRTEVTCGQYSMFLHQMALSEDRSLRDREDKGVPLRPKEWTGDDPPEGREHLPVTGVSWFGAFAYARWVGGRLPTEAEWERAAAGPHGNVFPWGIDFDPRRCRSGGDGPVPADSMLAGESPYSLLHTCGNVREWCLDRYDPRWYEQCSRDNPRWPSRTHHRVARGGSFASSQQNLVLQYRDHLPPAVQAADVGFRVVMPWPAR